MNGIEEIYYEEGRAYAYAECAEYMELLGYDYFASLFRSRIPARLRTKQEEPVKVEDNRPAGCRNRLRDEGKPHPKSGCLSCGNGGLVGCPHEKPATVETKQNDDYQPTGGVIGYVDDFGRISYIQNEDEE